MQAWKENAQAEIAEFQALEDQGKPKGSELGYATLLARLHAHPAMRAYLRVMYKLVSAHAAAIESSMA